MKKQLSWRSTLRTLTVALAAMVLLIPDGFAQKLDEEVLGKINYRSVGPTRQGGRYIDFAVYEKDPSLFYAALASGGVWRTDNNGITFESIFDNAGPISVGDIAVDQNDPEILWVGTGEANNSRTAYYGDGIYKTTDGGKTWINMGLEGSQHIGRILIHPENSKVLFVAAEGPLYSNNETCGVYKTTNGGKSWKKVLSVTRDGKHIGVVDLVMEPGKPDVLYAAAYDKERRPWTFNAGGLSSAIYKSTNGGKSWTKLGGGLPEGVIGRIGVDVSQSEPNVVYANVENCNVEGMSTEERWEIMKAGQPLERGQREVGVEVYRSEDFGETWKKVGDKIGGSPAYYYQQVRIDPTDSDHVYIVGIRVWETKDAGENWGTAFRFGGDNHALWIDINNPKHLVLGYDHGMGITYDAGENWYHPDFKDVGQFVAIGFDNRYPYYVYGGLQDNGSSAGPSSKANGSSITLEDWYRTGGGDGMYNVVDPVDWRWLYNESQNGPISRRNQETGESQSIRYRDMDRWAWNAPIFISPHNNKTIYHGGNKLVKSTNRGESWVELSGDLTTQDEVKIAGTGNIQYCTIVTADESPVQQGVLWVGTDDGKVWVSKNGGEEWIDLTNNITDHPGYWVSRVEPSNFDAATAYVTIIGQRNDDFRPFVWKTTDFGETWTSIASNLPNDPLCVIREHHQNPDLLFVGSTKEIHVSIDGGKNWSSLRNNMPYVAIEDLQIHPRENDLIVGTHGRSIWIADISYLAGLSEKVLNKPAYLFKPETKVQWNRSRTSYSSASSNFQGRSEASGVPVHYYLGEADTEAKLQILEGGKVIYEADLDQEPGVGQIVWNFTKRIRKRTDEEKKKMEEQRNRYRQYAGFGSGRNTGDPDYITGKAGPGFYTAKLLVNGKAQKQEFFVMDDHWK
ncbi:MAG: hypothetical protein HOK84_12485 [Bacteroidetes bacterium]|nr:hypothetical protein [Bacteroidota bacterium]